MKLLLMPFWFSCLVGAPDILRLVCFALLYLGLWTFFFLSEETIPIPFSPVCSFPVHSQN